MAAAAAGRTNRLATAAHRLAPRQRPPRLGSPRDAHHLSAATAADKGGAARVGSVSLSAAQAALAAAASLDDRICMELSTEAFDQQRRHVRRCRNGHRRNVRWAESTGGGDGGNDDVFVVVPVEYGAVIKVSDTDTRQQAGDGYAMEKGKGGQHRPGPSCTVVTVMLKAAMCCSGPPRHEGPPLLSHPCFYLDALYVHAHPNEEVQGQLNECQGMCDALHAAISGGATATAYLCEQIHNARMLGRHLTLLLAHGAQRQPRDVLGRHVYYNADPAAAAVAGGERGASQPPQARPAGEVSLQRRSSTSPPAERMQQQQE
ncbi:hypothetical protein JKP88DRAFT_282465 [Tribonema minus]|uniref:Uncharacterized protein n=1 Tax=Tribonema minus TaxID=303371 RepID=A0A836CA32_9STRA|nr:hypothetical protein JKP88DRAFT_282465 [Tribonema minus]